MPDSTTLRIEEHPDRVVVELRRPKHRNAVSAAMIDELHEVAASLEREPRFLIVTGGTDGVFAAGADIAELRARRAADALRGINLSAFERLRRVPLPSVAAIDGYALGGGAELAYACDLRVVSDRAVLGNPEPRLGIIAAAGGTRRLVDLVGETIAKELLFTGRQVDAEEALRLGLVNRVVAPDDLLATAHELVDQMACCSLPALRVTKLAVDAPVEAHPHVELLGQAVLFEDEEKYARMTAFLERSSEKLA